MLLSLIGAGPGMGTEAGPQDRFVLAYSARMFYDVDQKDATAALTVYSKEIAKEHGAQVESIFYKDPEGLADAFLAGKVDLAVFMSDDYARLSHKLDFDMAMSIVRGGKKTERFFILVKSDSPYHNLQDLRNQSLSRAKGDGLGLLYLDGLLLKQKLPEAAKYFSVVNETVKPSQALLAVFFGQSDVCIVNERSYDLMSELNPQVKVRLRSIGVSPEYVLGVGIFRKDMPAEKRKILENALLNIGDSPRGKQVLTLFKTERFAPILPGELESVRQLIRENDAMKVR
jgi:phosphonate transport system substrate-binding protein